MGVPGYVVGEYLHSRGRPCFRVQMHEPTMQEEPIATTIPCGFKQTALGGGSKSQGEIRLTMLQ